MGRLIARAPGVEAFIASNEYGRYCVPRNSKNRPAPRAILEGRVYEQGLLEFIATYVGDGDIVHAGAYFGDFLPLLSRTRRPEAVVWAFEPVPFHAWCARMTCTLNGIDHNVALQECALGAQEATRPMMVKNAGGKSLGGGSKIRDKELPADRAVEVAVQTIDQSIPSQRNVSAIQLDVEGHEKEALCGAWRTIRDNLPFVILERGRVDKAWIAENLKPLGYEFRCGASGNDIYEVKR